MKLLTMKLLTFTERGLPEIDLFQELTERRVTDVNIHHDIGVLEITLYSQYGENIKFKSIKHLRETMSMVNPLDDVAKRVQTIVDKSIDYNMLVDKKKYDEELYMEESYKRPHYKFYDVLSPIGTSKLHQW